MFESCGRVLRNCLLDSDLQLCVNLEYLQTVSLESSPKPCLEILKVQTTKQSSSPGAKNTHKVIGLGHPSQSEVKVRDPGLAQAKSTCGRAITFALSMKCRISVLLEGFR